MRAPAFRAYSAQQRAFFEARLAAHGAGPAGVGWSARSQDRQFGKLAAVGLAGRSVLDVGCGYGGLFGWLLDHSIGPVRYSGFEIVPGLLAAARERYPGLDWRLFDILTEETDDRWDYVVCCGAWNLRSAGPGPGNMALLERALERMFALCEFGMSVTLTSALADVRYPDVYHYDPAEVLRAAARLTPNVMLDHSILPHVFCLYAWRRELRD